MSMVFPLYLVFLIVFALVYVRDGLACLIRTGAKRPRVARIGPRIVTILYGIYSVN